MYVKHIDWLTTVTLDDNRTAFSVSHITPATSISKQECPNVRTAVIVLDVPRQKSQEAALPEGSFF